MARQAARVVDGGQRRRDGDGARKIDSAMAVAARTAGHTGHWGIWGRGGAGHVGHWKRVEGTLVRVGNWGGRRART